MPDRYSYTDLLQKFESAIHRIDQFQKIPDDLFLLKPGPKSWSASEIFSHITQFNTLYIREIRTAAENPVQTADPNITFKPGSICGIFIRFLEPPYKIKLKTVSPMSPDPDLNQQSARNILLPLLSIEKELTELVRNVQLNRIDIDQTKGQNPLLTWIPMTITELFLVLDAHQRRHVWQAEQTLYSLSGTRF